MNSSIISKIIFIFSLLSLTYLYATYEKNKFVKMDEESTGAPVLKTMPAFTVEEHLTDIKITPENFVGKVRGTFFHIWGSWCGPCEAEMPEFLSYARKLEDQGVRFLLVAVNDTPDAVTKFMKRFGDLPKNVQIAIDRDNRVMETFGTFKVPETFLFDKQGKNVNKFVGPQDWQAESYVTRLSIWLGPISTQMIQIKTH